MLRLLAPGILAVWLPVLALCQLSSKVYLSTPLADWKHELEQRGGRRILLVRVHTDRERNELFLAPDAEVRDTVRNFLTDKTTAGQFVASHALTLNRDTDAGRLHLILLNMARAGEWAGAEDPLIAHEFGHIWLDAAGYRSAPFLAGPLSCIGLHSGDIVQHVLIRKELGRRDIPFLAYWLPNLQSTLTALESEERLGGDASPCQTVSRVALWVDVLLGLSEESWDGYSRFLGAMGKKFPELQPHVDFLAGYLGELDLEDKAAYSEAISRTQERLLSLITR